MTNELRRVLILADESADWTVAGLRQLDRLALSLNDHAVRNKLGAPIGVTILWDSAVDRLRRWLPKDGRLTKVAFVPNSEGEVLNLVLSTRLFLYRGVLPQLIEGSTPLSGSTTADEGKELWRIGSQHLESLSRSRNGAWENITSPDEIQEIERRFLRGSGKSQDGVVSRYLNRPISSAMTVCLLRFPITPNVWTVAIFPIVVVATLILIHGTYWSFLLGLLLFQLFSILDGCDGEIARAKFLESERGCRLDDFFDVLSNILLALGLGLGLSRQVHWFYGVEGVAAAAVIAVSEFLLTRSSPNEETAGNSLGGKIYPRHRALVERSGLLLLGERFAVGLIQLTKRDVAVLFFVLLAAIGQAVWILHLLLLVTGVSLVLAWRACSKP